MLAVTESKLVVRFLMVMRQASEKKHTQYDTNNLILCCQYKHLEKQDGCGAEFINI